MPIQFPPDAKRITDQRLTIIRAVCTLHDKHVKNDGGLADQVKAAMQAKQVVWAESDAAVARLDFGQRGSIDAKKAFAKLKEKGIKADQILECFSVSATALKEHLSESEIREMTTTTACKPSLVTEFKEGFEIDTPAVLKSISAKLMSQLRKSKAA